MRLEHLLSGARGTGSRPPAGGLWCGVPAGTVLFLPVAAAGGLAQLVERLLCKQEVNGSSPLSSTQGVIDMMGTRRHNF